MKLALDRGHGGPLEAPSAYFCKHPPCQYTDDEAYRLTENFISVMPTRLKRVSEIRRRQRETVSN